MKIFLLFILLLPIVGNSQLSLQQEATIDSLEHIIKTSKNDREIVTAIGYWDNIIYITDPELDHILNHKKDSLCAINLEKDLSKEDRIFFLESKATALNNLGIAYKHQGDFAKAIQSHASTIEIFKQLGDPDGVSDAFNNIGIIYSIEGDYATSIEYHSKSLNIREKTGDKKGTGGSFGNIGNIYGQQGDYDRALEYYTKSLANYEEIEYRRGMSSTLNNIGMVYDLQGDSIKAMDYCTRSLIIRQEDGDKKGMASSYNTIGSFYHNLGDLTMAMDYFNKSLTIYKEIGSKKGLTACYYNIGNLYYEQGDINKSVKYNLQALTLAQELGQAIEISNASKALWKIYSETGHYKESLEMYELYITTKDITDSEENHKEVIRQEFKYNYSKKEALASAVHEAELERQELKSLAEQKEQNIIIAAVSAGLLLVGLFLVFAYNRLRVIRKQKNELSHQNTIIEQQKQKVDQAFENLEEAHKEITDSINYAERIQRSFLATDELLNENLNEYFVYFNPKEAVSGDFYWAGELHNSDFAVVNADSTGHGVPGAIMSILNISSIEKAVDQEATGPADIFNRTRKTIIERLKKDGSPDGGKDGMDASLVTFNSEKTKMSYVAAQNPIWIIRDNELTEIKPEKMPVGKHDHDHIPFKGGEYDIQKGDQIYTLTDGFQDQFGGPRGKKFMVKKMREYVVSICHLSMDEQHQRIQETFTNWKGEFEQIDDVCVIGIKI